MCAAPRVATTQKLKQQRQFRSPGAGDASRFFRPDDFASGLTKPLLPNGDVLLDGRGARTSL